MVLQEISTFVRTARHALGLSQAQLAALADLSRATIIDLEAGKLTELGVSKLEKLLAILGGTFEVSPLKSHLSKGKQSDALTLAAQTASVSYRAVLSSATLEESFVSGSIPSQYRAHLATLINEAPAPLLIRAVQSAAERRHVKPKTIWKNLSRWSHELQTTRSL